MANVRLMTSQIVKVDMDGFHARHVLTIHDISTSNSWFCLAKWTILSHVPDVRFEKRVALAAQEGPDLGPGADNLCVNGC